MEQQEKIFQTVMNEGVNIHYKSVMTQVFTVLGLVVELGTAISKSKGYLEAYLYIS